tara:strand:- start:14676 stop:15254 length:579 start_codon:yes stop_codon:yes gene_type:complete
VKFYVIFGNWRFYMSRIGKLPIKIPESVDFVSNENILTVKGKFGTLERTIPNVIEIEKNDDILIVGLKNQTRTNRALHGLYRTLINNMFIGVSEQFKRTLILKGVGYRASVQNKLLTLSLGYSHPVEIAIPEEISVEIVKNTTLNLKGCDKENLGLFAANIRSWRPPEPYKGKGIVYEGEIVKRKAGKSGKK